MAVSRFFSPIFPHFSPKSGKCRFEPTFKKACPARFSGRKSLISSGFRRVRGLQKRPQNGHPRHSCIKDSKSGSRASGSWVRIPPYPPRSRQQSVFPAAGVSFCANETAGQYQPRADAPSQTTFAVYTARAMRLRAKNERGRCLPAALRTDGVRVLVGFWQRFLRGRSGRVERKHSKENERRLIYE